MRLLLIILIATSLSGCAIFGKEDDPTKGWSANQIYSAAKAALNEGDYEEAVKLYEILESRYPFGRYAQQAQLEVAYAYYKYDEPASAIAAADRFIKLHPRHPHVDYAYYLKGIVNFNRDRGFLERFFPIDASTRDPASTKQSFEDFRELVQRFPESQYAADAHKRMLYLRNALARHELNVARYYITRKAYVAAANRAKYVVEHYHESTAVPEALEIMVQAYTELGLTQLANDAQRVLELNFPQRVAEGPKEEKKSWFSF